MPISLSIFFSGAGSEPEWNETFIFTVSDETPQLHLKIMDSDLTNDDFVGEATYVIILIRQTTPAIYLLLQGIATLQLVKSMFFLRQVQKTWLQASLSLSELSVICLHGFVALTKPDWPLICAPVLLNCFRSASPWRLCFRKAAFLRQFIRSSRRRNTAERSSLHSPSLQQWYITK